MKKEKTTNTGILNYKYLGEVVDIYNYLNATYPKESVYFSEYLDKPSACIEIKKVRYEFYVAENTMKNNEVWLFKNWQDTKESGGGRGDKINNDLLDQVKNFLPKIEKEIDLFNWND